MHKEGFYKEKIKVASAIIGSSIENTDGEKLGSIKDIMINIHSGKLEYIVMETEGFLNINSKLFAIPLKEISNHASEDKFLLNRNKEFIKNAPGFDKDHWPYTNSNYKSIETYWGDMGTTEIKDDTTGPGKIEPELGTLDPV